MTLVPEGVHKVEHVVAAHPSEPTHAYVEGLPEDSVTDVQSPAEVLSDRRVFGNFAIQAAERRIRGGIRRQGESS